jgi:hypothetical protein
MADKKISQLPSITGPLTGSEEVAIVQGGVTKKGTVQDIVNAAVPYKVYRALLTQSGNDNPDSIISDLLTIGVTYTINNFNPSYTLGDFTNVGAPNNNIGTSFVATGTTPNNWGTSIQLEFNTGAPVATVLENTIGTITYDYDSAGSYGLNSSALFTSGKTFVMGGGSSNNASTYVYLGEINSTSRIVIRARDLEGTFSDDIMANTPIEILVYP